MSNRELATLLWVVIMLLCGVIYNKRGRHNIILSLRIIFNLLKNSSLFFFMLYEIVIIMILYLFIGMPFLSRIGEYVISLSTTIFPLLARDFSNNYISDFKHLVKNTLLFSTFISSLINQYTFSFLIECIIVFIICFISLLSVYFNDSKNGNKKLGRLLNKLIFMIFIIILFRSIYQFVLNYDDITNFDFWISYFMPIFVFLIHFPFLYLWHFISMIDVSIQWFDNRKPIDYIKYLVEKKELKVKLRKNIPIDWSKINVEQKSNSNNRNYKLIIKDNLSLNEIKYIVKNVECMNAPRSIYKTDYIYFPVKIWVMMNNKLVAIWRDARLNNDYKKIIDKDFHKVDNGLYAQKI